MLQYQFCLLQFDKVCLMPKILLLNGPNLNLLGTREPEIYGYSTLPEIEQLVIKMSEESDFECEAFQSNHEGQLIDWLHQNRQAHFLILNPGAFSHTSIALRDAISAIQIPFVEVHLSNVYQREPFRKQSYFADIAVGILAGLGIKGYELATKFAIDWLTQKELPHQS